MTTILAFSTGTIATLGGGLFLVTHRRVCVALPV
jgi:hypothetical protein